MGADLAAGTLEESLDHLLLGVGDLDRGIEWVENLTGVRAIAGGSHPGLGTRNALLALGGRRYLEIIAPDPKQSAFRFRIDLRSLTEPRFISWAAARDTEAILKVAQKAGYGIVGPDAGSRARPDGKVLKWTMVAVQNSFDRPEVEVVPFFISWAEDSVHPSEDSRGGSALLSFHIFHPDPPGLANTLMQFGIQAPVERGAQARLVARLQTPKGRVEMG